jgi:hypothetical protein
MAPVWLKERETMLATVPTNVAVIKALVRPLEVEPTNSIINALEATALDSDIDFIKEIVNEVLVEKGL